MEEREHAKEFAYRVSSAGPAWIRANCGEYVSSHGCLRQISIEG